MIRARECCDRSRQHRRHGVSALATRRSTPPSSSANSLDRKLAAAGLAITTMSRRIGARSRFRRNHSRIWRFTRVLTTAFPTLRLTVIPSFARPSPASPRCSESSRTNDRDATRTPSRETRRKSLGERRRSVRRKRWLPPVPVTWRAVTSRASKPPVWRGPWPAVVRGPSGRLVSSSERGTRGFGGGEFGSVDRFAS